MVREVRLAQDVQPRDGAHQVVVHPQAAHRVVDGRVDPHRHLVRILVGDLLVHLEEVAVARAHGVLADPADRVGEIQVDGQLRLADAAALVADRLGGARRDVAGHQVAEARVAPLEVVVALGFGDLLRRPLVAAGLRHPDAPVVAQALAHQRELGLVIARHRDAGRVDLREARVGEQRAALVAAPRRRDVRVHGVGREVVGRAVAAGGEADGVGDVRLELAGQQVAHDDAARLAVDEHEIEHLAVGEQRHRAGLDLPHQRLVGADQQLLPGLAAGVEGARDLGAAERAVVEDAAVLARERHALGDRLVDDLDAGLGQAIDVGLAGPVVAALDGVVEQPLDAVAVVAVVLGGVDAALGGDAVGAPRRVVDAERLDVVAQLAERRRRRGAGEAGADDDDRELALVGRVHQLHLEAVPVPLVGDGAARNLRVELHGRPPK